MVRTFFWLDKTAGQKSAGQKVPKGEHSKKNGGGGVAGVELDFWLGPRMYDNDWFWTHHWSWDWDSSDPTLRWKSSQWLGWLQIISHTKKAVFFPGLSFLRCFTFQPLGGAPESWQFYPVKRRIDSEQAVVKKQWSWGQEGHLEKHMLGSSVQCLIIIKNPNLKLVWKLVYISCSDNKKDGAYNKDIN